ncbi:MAG: hypothetical protein QXT27_01785 [Pyrobaculum sp.]
MECPLCQGLVVFNGVEYVCSQCGTALGVEHVPPVEKAVKAAREKPKNEREWRRHMQLARASVTTAIKAPALKRVQWTPPSKRVEQWIWTLCYRLDIPAVECVRAVEAFRRIPRTAWQGSYPVNVAGAVLHLVFFMPVRHIQRIERSANEQSIRRLAKRLSKYLENNNYAETKSVVEAVLGEK